MKTHTTIYLDRLTGKELQSISTIYDTEFWLQCWKYGDKDLHVEYNSNYTKEELETQIINNIK